MKVTKAYLKKIIKEEINKLKEDDEDGTYQQFGKPMHRIEKLAGKTITHAPLIDEKKRKIVIELDNKWYEIRAESDGGNSYFYGCDAPEVFTEGTKLLEVEEFEDREQDLYTDYDDAINVYMLKFKTSAGRTNIEFRCEHNGYYYGYTEIEVLSGKPNLSNFKPLEQVLN